MCRQVEPVQPLESLTLAAFSPIHRRVFISSEVRGFCVMPCFGIGCFSRFCFHLVHSLLAPVSAHNSRLITPCSQLHSAKLRVRSVWAGKESPLSLRGRAFTFILSEVQPFVFIRKVGMLMCGLVTVIQHSTNRTVQQ